MDSKVSWVEEDAHVAREATEKAKEEVAQSKEQAVLAEEAADKAWEEAARLSRISIRGTLTDVYNGDTCTQVEASNLTLYLVVRMTLDGHGLEHVKSI
jgi:hypothetical protein